MTDTNLKKRPAIDTSSAPDSTKKIKQDEKSSSIQRARGKRLVMPKRRTKLGASTDELPALPKIEPVSENKESFECQFCGDVIYPPYPTRLKHLIKKLRENEKQYEKELREAYEAETAESRKNGQPVMPFVYQKSGLSKNDQEFICRTHRIELKFLPMGKEKGYPEKIDFDAIEERMTLFKDELQEIIDRKRTSTYLNNALEGFKKLGAKTRNAREVMNKLENFLPGYYGNRGMDAIMGALFKFFMNTSILNKDNAKPLTPIEFIQQVLVPETGLRLIRQDKDNKISMEEAEAIMKESQEYGKIVYRKHKKDKKQEGNDNT